MLRGVFGFVHVVAFSACVLLCLCGCATNKIDWQSRVGHYTYDQALLELGPPDRSAKLGDGGTVAEWLTERGYTSGTVAGGYVYPNYPYSYHTPMYMPYVSSTSPNKYIRLIFAADGQLQAWKNVQR